MGLFHRQRPSVGIGRRGLFSDFRLAHWHDIQTPPALGHEVHLQKNVASGAPALPSRYRLYLSVSWLGSSYAPRAVKGCVTQSVPLAPHDRTGFTDAFHLWLGRFFGSI